jgi:hypothetical protein
MAAVRRTGQATLRWGYLDARRTGDWWTCVLDDRTCIRVVKVHAYTGAAAVVSTNALPARRGRQPTRD